MISLLLLFCIRLQIFGAECPSQKVPLSKSILHYIDFSTASAYRRFPLCKSITFLTKSNEMKITVCQKLKIGDKLLYVYLSATVKDLIHRSLWVMPTQIAFTRDSNRFLLHKHWTVYGKLNTRYACTVHNMHCTV